MSNEFIALVYATLRERKKNENTDEWSVEKAIEEYNNLIGKTGRYNVETGELEDKGEKKMADKKFDTFEKQVDGVLSGEYKDQHITMREDTPKILQAIGIPNKPMLMTENMLTWQ